MHVRAGGTAEGTKVGVLFWGLGVGDNVAEGADLAPSPRPLSACGSEGGHEFSIFNFQFSIFSQGWGLVTGAG